MLATVKLGSRYCCGIASGKEQTPAGVRGRGRGQEGLARVLPNHAKFPPSQYFRWMPASLLEPSLSRPKGTYRV